MNGRDSVDKDQDSSLSPPPSPPQPPISSSSCRQPQSGSSHSVVEWIDRTLTQSPSQSPSRSSFASIFPATTNVSPHQDSNSVSTRQKRKRSPACDELIGRDAIVPLKRRNLQRHLAAIMPPYTPVNGKHSAAAASSTSAGTSERSNPRDHLLLREALKDNRMHLDHQVFHSDRYKDFKDLVLSPFDDERYSIATPDSVRKFQERHRYYGELNERTFTYHMLKMIVKEDLPIRLAKATETSDAIYVSRDEWSEGLRVQLSQSVRRNQLPRKYAELGFNAKQINEYLKTEGLANAEPDAVWGFDPEVMPEVEFATVETRKEMNLLPKLHWPFFVVQVKQDKGSYADACNEAIRDGATIVNVARKLYDKAGMACDKPGPDMNTFIYGAVMEPKVMQWYVHWAEVRDDGTLHFHMNTVVHSRVMEGPTALPQLRSPIHAILDWGTQTRKPMASQLYSKLEAHDRALLKRSAKENDSPASKASKRSKVGCSALPLDDEGI